ncbi:sulfite exporter TauE/SafE family protein [Pikeienuella piscinae]|uniref:Probable membrane transporter protein n=1 Tax=Pikeienuella piscinae TaxID=2748098 RepID=A0A7M3T5B6_9RHOB|nr:sulfite exporter TauE/SafE family protein [Pikeienuella piscinae]QIE57197.1 sulfite exporter TauE/SafE family protein [Pikeienuella piscinae]
MEWLADTLALTKPQAAYMVRVFFVAGVFRGFSGFGSSALAMGATVFILPPVAMIPVCWVLELVASLAMLREGVRVADRKMTVALTVGLFVGGGVGLHLTTSIPVEMSKLVALSLIFALAIMLLAKIKPRFLATGPGLSASGVVSGLAYGLAGVGGMVVALYVLARDMPARVARGSLVLYLLISAPFGGALLFAYGMLSELAMTRGVVLTVPALVGVIAGRRLFVPRYEPYYRPLCLGFILITAAGGVIRLAA